MEKKLNLSVFILLALSLILGACMPSLEPPIPKNTPASSQPVIPDAEARLTGLLAGMAKEPGYGSIEPAALNEERSTSAPFLLDVRDASEMISDGSIQGSVHVPTREVMRNLDKLPGLDEPIVVICASGHRSSMIMVALRLAGYTDVRSLNGGIEMWKKSGLPVMTGTKPEVPPVISTPAIPDQALVDALDAFLFKLPEGFLSLKPEKLKENLSANKPPSLVDVRTRAEREMTGFIQDTISIPFENFLPDFKLLPFSRDAHIIIMSDTSDRGSIITIALRLMGYSHVSNLNGGLNEWMAAGLPVVK